MFTDTYLYNFRNIAPARLSWTPGFNLITGPNGAGKTNLLEALSIVSGWGTLECGTKSSSLVRWGASNASLWCKVSGEEECELFATLSPRVKHKLDGKPATASSVRKRAPSLAFLADHISLVRGSSSNRRALIDRVGALSIAGYAQKLAEYKRALKHKAAALKNGSSLLAVNELLTRSGAWLWRAREIIVADIEKNFCGFSSLFPVEISVRYVRGGGGKDDDPLDDMRSALRRAEPIERARRQPHVGPQRDELLIETDGRAAREALSRGQSRRTAAAIVLASASAVERSAGQKPVLIIDELSSELDDEGTEATIDAMIASGCQIFASSATEIDRDDISVRHIERGAFR